MRKFKVAELVIEMNPKHAPLLPQSLAYEYFGHKMPEHRIDLSEKDQILLKNRFPDCDDALLEYMATGSMFYSALIGHSGLLLHASAVEVDGKAYLFSAPSGTGKSTHTALWLKHFGKRARIINDDKPAIRILDDTIYVYGTPWSGKTDLNINCKVPLQSICFLEQGKTNTIASLPSQKAIPMILEQTVRPRDPKLVSSLLDHIETLISTIPIFQMQCTPKQESVPVAYEMMSKGDRK